jgi:adenylate kinase family enzyme
VSEAVARDAWVIDGNYSAVRDLSWPRADTIVWLDLPRRVVMWRVFSRTVRRILTRTVLWSGNRESVRTAFSRDSIVLWAWSTYDRRLRDYPDQLAAHPHVAVVRLRTSREVRQFLAAVSSPAEARMAGRT